jgi:hypothetical protein
VDRIYKLDSTGTWCKEKVAKRFSGSCERSRFPFNFWELILQNPQYIDVEQAYGFAGKRRANFAS